MATLRLADLMPQEFIRKIRDLFVEKKYETALTVCREENTFASGIIAAGIASRKHGAQVMIETMKSEGRRSGNSLWQRISLLNEIAVVAPMLGLLGTVLGLFFAFYETNRTAESIASIFDGLGIAVGTTVLGLIVSILSMIFYTTLKFRVINMLSTVENEAFSLVSLMEVENQHSHPLHQTKIL
jgi:biopolymer transport protein ExbB